MSTLAWSPRVGHVYNRRDGVGLPVEILAEHLRAELVKIVDVQRLDRSEWLTARVFESLFAPSVCESCGAPLLANTVHELRGER